FQMPPQHAKPWPLAVIFMRVNNNFIKFWTFFSLLILFIFQYCKSDIHSSNEDLIFDSDTSIKNENAKKWFEKGLYYVRIRDYNWANKCFSKADNLFPNSPIILNSLGNSFYRTGEYDKAIESFDNALKIDSFFIKTYSNYGIALNGVGKYKDAKDILYLGLNKSPAHLNTIDRSVLNLNLAYTYHNLNNDEKALQLLDSAKQGLPQGELFNRIINAKLKLIKPLPVQK
ncbi:MAG: tetratricopeptide repeat protein, partial [Bacteroidetes bacterium]|nr:tetratricopeptide repeat protein [Bacteroidota bacterium]